MSRCKKTEMLTKAIKKAGGGKVQTSSDNWFVSVSGADILPDMFIGRLSAQTCAQVDDMIDKIIDYEQNPPDDTWSKDILLVAGEDPEFEVISEQIASLVPGDYVVRKVYVNDYPPGDPTTDIADAINAGDVLVNYSGHGSIFAWAREIGGVIFDQLDILALDNAHRLPVVTMATCLNGLFTGPQTEVSAAEAFVRLKDKGAAAAWASTSFGYAPRHQVLMGEFYETIFQEDEYVLGAATTAAKVAAYGQNSSWMDLVETFVLFGDPALSLGLPYPYLQRTIPADGAGDVPFDQDVRVVFHTPMDTATVSLDVEGVPTLPLTPTWSAGDTVVTYAHPDFARGQTLTFTVDGRDPQGNPLGVALVPSTWSFTVTEDDTPPYGTIGVEGGALADVPLSAAVIITFTEPMRTSSVVYTSVPPVAGSLSWTADGDVARFAHARFDPVTQYTFTVAAAKDVAGNSLADPLVLSFTTQEAYFVYLPLVVKEESP